MPSPEYRLVLSPQAEQDIENVLRYTGESWGEGQMQVYSDKLNTALQAIQFNPWIGHKSADLPDTHRLDPVGSHVIVYRRQERMIGVVRVLHERMSARHHV